MNIPKGYKLVPVEPTVAMEDAAALECGGYCPRCDTDMQIKTGMQVDIYRTMLDSAPTPPQPIYDESVIAWEVSGGGVRPKVYENKPEWALADPAYTVRELVYAQPRAKSVEVGHE